MSNTFNEICNESRGAGEHNDCTVKAISISTGVSYFKSLSQFSRRGRKHRHGCQKWVQNNVMEDLGYEVSQSIQKERRYLGKYRGISVESNRERFIQYYPEKDQVVQNVTMYHAEKFGNTKGWKDLVKLSKQKDVAILLYTSCHVSAFKDGKVVDWVAGKRKPITNIVIFRKKN